MSDYFTAQIECPGDPTAVQLVESATVDRWVRLSWSGDSTRTLVGFTEATVLMPSTDSGLWPPDEFLLPAGEELWGYCFSQNYALLMVTKVASGLITFTCS